MRDPNAAVRLARAFGRDRFFVELQRPYERGDTRRNAALRDLAETLHVHTVASGDVHAHDAAAPRSRTCSSRSAPAPRSTAASGSGAATTSACSQRRRTCSSASPTTGTRSCAPPSSRSGSTFDLTEELGYRYPDFSDGPDPAIVQLRRVCEHAFAERYSGLNGHKRRVRARLEEELALIDELGLAGFFLLHWEVLELAREVALEVRGPGSMRHVLPPGRGRGSSVGSLVCYLTGLSHVDPVAANLSLGRFLNRELSSVPDIDLDFPRDIREQLIVRVTEKYGREHAALVATFATYRSRGAIRDVGKALGLPFAELERLAKLSDGWNAHASPRRWRCCRMRRRSSPRRAGARSPSCARRSPACRATSRSTPAGWSSRRARSSSSSPCSRPRWRAGRCASGTRTRAPTRASSRSTCWGWECSPRSRSAST